MNTSGSGLRSGLGRQAAGRLPLRLLLLTVVASFALPILAGCGAYSAGEGGGEFDAAEGRPAGGGGTGAGYKWGSLYRDDVRTVAVPIFENRSFRRGVEFRLTQAIVKSMESQTPYKVAPREDADTVLEGEITDISLRTISSDARTGVPQEQIYRVRVNFVWKDLRNGRILVQRRYYEQTAPFYPTLGEGQFYGSQLNVERLALAIVNEMQADW